MWYLRYWVSKIRATAGKGFYAEKLITVHEAPVHTANSQRCDLVELESGQIFKADSGAPMPEWLKDPLIRQMVQATGKIPEPH
jgi:hypothetical protein